MVFSLRSVSSVYKNHNNLEIDKKVCFKAHLFISQNVVQLPQKT